jgi:hypothetical protein
MKQYTYIEWLGYTSNGENRQCADIESPQGNLRLVILPRDEIIEFLKALDGMKKKLHLLLKE